MSLKNLIYKTFDEEGDAFPREVFYICAQIYDTDQEKITFSFNNLAMAKGLQLFFQKYPQVIPRAKHLEFKCNDNKLGIVRGTGYKDHTFAETFDAIKGKTVRFPNSERVIINSKKYAIYGAEKHNIDPEDYFTMNGEKVFTSIAYNRLMVQIDKLKKNTEIPADLNKLLIESLEILIRRDFNDDLNDEKLIALAELTRLINEIFDPTSTHHLENIKRHDLMMEKLKVKPFFKAHFKLFEKLRSENILLKKLEILHGKDSVEALLQGNMHHMQGGKKTIWLDKLAKKIRELEKRGGQNAKTLALSQIYFQFRKLNFSKPDEIKNIRTLISTSRPQLRTFDSTCGKLGAFVKQLFFNAGYKTTTNQTEMLADSLWDFIESQIPAKPISPLKKRMNN